MATQKFSLNGTQYESTHRSFYGGKKPILQNETFHQQIPKPIAPPTKPIAPPQKPVAQEILYPAQPCTSYQSQNGTIFYVMPDRRTTYKTLDMKQNSKWKILSDGHIVCNACGYYKLIKNNGTFEMLQLVII